jgi:hypothetical protein
MPMTKHSPRRSRGILLALGLLALCTAAPAGAALPGPPVELAVPVEPLADLAPMVAPFEAAMAAILEGANPEMAFPAPVRPPTAEAAQVFPAMLRACGAKMARLEASELVVVLMRKGKPVFRVDGVLHPTASGGGFLEIEGAPWNREIEHARPLEDFGDALAPMARAALTLSSRLNPEDCDKVPLATVAEVAHRSVRRDRQHQVGQGPASAHQGPLQPVRRRRQPGGRRRPRDGS